MRLPAHYGFNNNNDSNNNGFAVKTHMARESTVGESVKAIYLRLYSILRRILLSRNGLPQVITGLIDLKLMRRHIYIDIISVTNLQLLQ